MTRLKTNLFGAVLYLLFLALSHSLSLDYRLEPVLWPVTAVLPAILILWGRQAVLLALLVSLLYFYLPPSDFLPFFGVDLPLTIGLLMTALNYLKAEVTVALIRRYIALDRLGASSRGDLIKLILISGPVGGTLGMIMVIPAFWSIAELSLTMRLQAMAQWWLAMTAGGAIFMPLLMVVFDRRARKTTSAATYLSVSLLTIFAFLALLLYQKNSIQNTIANTQQQQEAQAKALIAQQLETLSYHSLALASAVSLKPDLNNEAFQRFVNRIENNQSGYLFNFLSWSAWVPHAERADYERRQQCQITSSSAFGFASRLQQDHYLPVTFLYPAGIADQVLCFDMLSETKRALAIQKAFSTGQPQLTEPIPLANNSELGFILITPVKQQDETAGIISAVISSQQIFSGIESILAEYSHDLNWLHRPVEGEPKQLYPSTNHLRPIAEAFSTTPLTIYGQQFWPVWPLNAETLQNQFGLQSLLFSGLGALIIVLIQTITFYLLLMNATIANEVREKTKKLNEASEQAQAAALAKSRFLANMSHEIRTPLNAILGYAELATTEKHPIAQREYLQGINSSSESLLSLVNDILDYSKIEAGKFELSLSPFSLLSLSDRLEAIFSMQAKQKKLEFKTTLDTLDDRLVIGDQSRILQILINLVSNALKFTSKGSVKVRMILKPVDTHSGILHIHVTDTGIGMNETVAKQVFEEFTQADSGIAKHYGGTGLGLSIAKSLVTLMSGEIDIDSTVGVGTRFHLMIPLQISDRFAGHTAPIPTVDLPRSRVLIVDDNEINLRVTESLLKRMDMTVITASSGTDAIRIIQQLKPDLVFMDMQMPEMDGLQTTKLLRNHYSPHELVIVGLSANADISDHNACLAAGMNDHISKPVSSQKLRSTLAHWLAN